MNTQDPIIFPLKRLWLAHIFFIVLSNYAVQLPVTFFGITTTWGTFTYPFIFLLTDLTVRIFTTHKARRIVFFAMLPALILSYAIGSVFQQGAYAGVETLVQFNVFVFRIALASFVAYAVGQLLDIFVFDWLRQTWQWWLAPAVSSVISNLLDTFLFYGVAFYQTSDPFMAEHWIELAWVDYAVKMTASLLIFVPMYGFVLNFLRRRIQVTGRN